VVVSLSYLILLHSRPGAEEAGSGQRTDSTIKDMPGSNQAPSENCNKQLISAVCQPNFHFKVKTMNWVLSELTSAWSCTNVGTDVAMGTLAVKLVKRSRTSKAVRACI